MNFQILIFQEDQTFPFLLFEIHTHSQKHVTYIYIYTHIICLPDFSNPCKYDRSNYSKVSGLKTSQLSDVVTHSDRRRMSLQPNLLELLSGSLIGIAFLAQERERMGEKKKRSSG